MRDYVDTFGRGVRVRDDPRRLVSLVPSVTEILFDFGRGEQVVALTDYCTEPAAGVAGKTTVGGTKNPDVAAIIDLQPDLVLAVAEENRRVDVDQLAAAGVPVYVFEPRTVRDGIDLLWRVADLLGCRSEVAGRIEAIEHELADTEAVAATRPPVRVFCPIWKDPYMTINHDTYIHAMLAACGGDTFLPTAAAAFRSLPTWAASRKPSTSSMRRATAAIRASAWKKWPPTAPRSFCYLTNLIRSATPIYPISPRSSTCRQCATGAFIPSTARSSAGTAHASAAACASCAVCCTPEYNFALRRCYSVT